MSGPRAAVGYPPGRRVATPPVLAAGAAGGVAVGIVAGAQALGLLVLLCVAAVAAIVMAAGPTLRRTLLTAIWGVLAGYAFFGRQFAYVGYPPLFIGDCVLMLGLIIAVRGGRWRRLGTKPAIWLVITFAVWGAVRTAPYVSDYGLAALRDAVIWGYGAFSVLLLVALKPDDIDRALEHYGRIFIWLPLWVPCLFLLNRILGDGALMVPWADVSLVAFKAGELAAHLAGIGAFAALGMTHDRRSTSVFWFFWLVALALVGSLTRGGLLAIVAALWCVAMLGTPQARRRLRYVSVAGVSAALCAVVFASGRPQGDDAERSVSVDQLKANISSVLGQSDYGNLDGTREWRLAWWTDITNYTVHGPLFWTGKGFGVNLADDDGFQVESDGSLRSPHSVHMTILARSGVPGIVMWATLNISFALTMLAGYFRARAASQQRWASVHVWVLAYWLALVMNASFDVYFESPSGGIWFWSVIGFGLAVTHVARIERAASPALRVVPEGTAS